LAFGLWSACSRTIHVLLTHHPRSDWFVVVELGLVLLAAVSDRGRPAPAHLARLISPARSTPIDPTVSRAPDEADELQIARIHSRCASTT
jgi:hypothetical protein